jgi:hypothetical protein
MALVDADDFRRHAPGSGGSGDIVNDAGAGADDRVLADAGIRDDGHARADESQSSDFHVAGNRAPRSHMGAFCHPAIVIDGGAGVDDRKVVYPGLRIDDRTGHDRDPAAQLGTRRDHRRRTDRVHDLESDLSEMTTHPQAVLIVSNSHECVLDSVVAQSREIGVGSYNGHAQHRWSVAIEVDQADDFMLACCSQELYHNLYVAACADDQER